MSNDIIRPQASALAVAGNQEFWSATQLAALNQIGVQNASPGDLAVFLNYAQRTGLDPFSRQIYMIGRWSKNGTKWTIQTSIDGLRIVAQRSGDYAGQAGPEFCGADGIWRDNWVSKEPPAAARIGVLRKGFDQPLWAVAYYDEYVQTDKDGKATQMWREKPRLMLAKCAEALALRKAFPNDLAGLYVEDEMGQADSHPTQPASEPVQQITDTETGEVFEGEVVDESKVTAPQLKAIGAIFGKCHVEDREQRLSIVAKIINRPIESASDLSKAEASDVIDAMSKFADQEDPKAALDSWLF